MAQYIIMYLGGDRFAENNSPPDPNIDPAASKAKWGQWVQNLGAAAVNPGTPMMHSKIISPNGVTDAGKQGSTGYTIVEAENMDAAIEMAKGCPYLEMGSLEVAELMQMQG